MTTGFAPGIRHEEDFTSSGPILGDDTSIAGFIGKSTWGPLTPQKLTSFSQYLNLYGGYRSDSDLTYAVKGFFDNGGKTCYVQRQIHYNDVSLGTYNALASTKVVNDQAAVPASSFSLDAKYVGIYGDSIDVDVALNPKVTTALAANVNNGAASFTVTSPTNIEVGQILELDDGAGTVEFVKVASIVTTVSGGVPTHTVTPTAVIGTAGTPAFAAADVVSSQEFDVNVYYEDSATAIETWSQLSMESGATNNIETQLNADTGSKYISCTITTANALYAAGYAGTVTKTYYPTTLARVALASGVAAGTIDSTDLAGNADQGVGVHAYDGVDDVRIIAMIPDSGQASYAPGGIYEALNIAELRKDVFVIAEIDQDDNPPQAITNREADGYNSKYGAIYFNRIKVLDPLVTDGTRFISPLGHIAGLIAGTDIADGPWVSPAGPSDNGKRRGRINGALDVENSTSVTQRANLNDAGINLIRSMGVNGVVVMGARTLKPQDATFKWMNTTRALQYFETSTSNSLGWAVFMNNDSALWSRVREEMRDFLFDAWEDGALKGDTPEDAFQVLVGESDGVQDVADTAAGRVVSEVLVALQRPGEFLIFKWSELTN